MQIFFKIIAGIAAICVVFMVLLGLMLEKKAKERRRECEQIRQQVKQQVEAAMRQVRFSGSSFDGQGLKLRIHNDSEYHIYGNYIFQVVLEDCSQSGCTQVSSGLYDTNLGSIDRGISPGAAQDVSASAADFSIPQVRPQGEIRYTFKLEHLEVDRASLAKCLPY